MRNAPDIAKVQSTFLSADINALCKLMGTKDAKVARFAAMAYMRGSDRDGDPAAAQSAREWLETRGFPVAV